MPSFYPVAAKILGEYQKPSMVIPSEGFGARELPSDPAERQKLHPGDKAVHAIKLMATRAIETSVLDEAAAIEGSRPLEQIADACGYAWGSTCLQMSADLTHFNVLLMIGKSFTPAQQAWPALVLEAHAQLMGKRAQRKILGNMRSICWTDHANLTK